MKALHCICHRDGSPAKPVGLSSVPGNPGVYRSLCWVVPSANELINGWLYLHERSSEGAHFSGIIVDIEPEPCMNSMNQAGVVFTVRRAPQGDGSAWRGKKPTQSVYTGGIVDATYEHEVGSN